MEGCAIIVFETSAMLAMNSHEWPAEGQKLGYRPYVWTRNLERAEKFASRDAAQTWANCFLPHDNYEIRELLSEKSIA